MFPKCGDGVDFSVILSPVGGGAVQYLHEADYELSDKPTRQRLHFYLDKLETGDVIDFTVYPRGQHDCDGAAAAGGADLGAGRVQGARPTLP